MSLGCFQRAFCCPLRSPPQSQPLLQPCNRPRCPGPTPSLVHQPPRSPSSHCSQTDCRLPSGRRTHARAGQPLLKPARNQKMRRSGLVFLLCVSAPALCYDIKIAPPTLGLRRLFRKPYRGPICVIEIVGAEMKPIANRGTARSLGPRGPRSRPHLPRPRCAPVASCGCARFGRATVRAWG